jgi:DNA polymerase-3 subunit beta
MYSSGKDVNFVATDSYRLAEKKITLTEKPGEDFYCIVPAKTLIELGKIINKGDKKDVKINISKNQILFNFNDVKLISRLIEGKFPEYEKIIPKDTKTKAEVSVDELTLVLKRVSLFARENNNSIKLTITNDGKLTISSDETKVGEEKAEINVKVEGENNKISLNAQYLLDVLMYVGEDKIFIGINDKASPAVIKKSKGDSYVYIIMPLKV